MNKIKQLISYILVIQLCVSCTGSGGSSSLTDSSSGTGGTSGETILIQGQISKVFRGVSDFILPSAIAEDGTITAYDMTDPENPKQIGAPAPVESEAEGYSIELNAEEVKGAIIKLKYVGLVGERDLLVDVDSIGDGTGDMNEVSHFESGILEEQLKLEGIEDKVQLKKRFVELKEESGVEKDLALFGDSESMREILRTVGDENKELRDGMKKLVAQARAARNRGEGEDRIIDDMVVLAKTYFGDDYSSRSVLNCSGPRASFFIESGKIYRFSLQGYDLEVLRAYQESGGSREFGEAKSSEEANQILSKMAYELKELSLKYQKKNLSGIVTVSDISEGEIEDDKTCRLYASSEEAPEPVYFFDLKLLEDIPHSVADTQEQFKRTLLENFEKFRGEYSEKLQGMKDVGDLFDIVLKIEDAKANKLIQKRVSDYGISSSDSFDPSLLDAVDFEKLATYDEGSRALEDAFRKTVDQLYAKTTLVEVSKSADSTTEEEAAIMKEAFMNVERTLTEAATAENSLTQEELAQQYFLSRLDDLRKYFGDKYKADYAYNPEIINSIKFENLNLDEGAQRLTEGMRLSIVDVNNKIKNKGGLESLANSEVLYFQLRDIISQLESRLVEFQDYVHTGSTSYVMDRSRISSLSYNNLSSALEASQQAEMARSFAMDALKERFINEGGTDEEYNVLAREQKILSEVILNAKRFENSVCFQGEVGSLLMVCRDERELIARRTEAATMTKSLSEKLQATEF